MFNMKKIYLLIPVVLLAIAGVSTVVIVKSNQKPHQDSENNTETISNQISIEDSSNEEQPRQFDYKNLSKAAVKDKVLGGWIGHAIGLGSGFEYVVATDNVCEFEKSTVDGYTVDGMTAIVGLADRYFEPDGQICNGSIGTNSYRIHPINDPRVIRDNVYSDDDMHVDVLNQFIFRDYGPKLGNNDIASAWKFYDLHDVGGGADTRNLTQNLGYIPPYTGQSTYGCIGYWVTEAWIENETIGMLFPYMYEQAEGYADMFCQVQGDAYGYYLGKLCAMMYSLAYEYDDLTTIIEKSFDIMGKSNEIYEMYKYVKKCYQQKVSWRQACIGVVERAVNCARIKVGDMAGFSINANAGMIFTSLLYGEGDFEQTIKICSLCGLDGDCTTATVGGLVGMIIGYDNLPDKYKGFLNKNSKYHNYTGSNSEAIGVYWGPFAYAGKNFPNTITFDYLADLTVGNIENVIKEYNGEVNGDEYKVAMTSLATCDSVEVNNYSFENGNTDDWHITSKSGNATLIASKAAVHIGKFGGSITLEDEKDCANVFHNVSLKKDHYYKMNLWINGATDREFKIYAKDDNHKSFRSYVNPLSLSNRHMKAELVFKATSDNMEIGIEIPETFEDAYSTVVSIDDLFIEDVTKTISRKTYQTIEAENTKLNDYATKENSDKYSNNGAALLTGDDSLEGQLVSSDDIISIKFYYSNKSTSLGTIQFDIDNQTIANVPLVSNGISNYFDETNYQEIIVYVGKGTHDFKITNLSFEDVAIDRIDICSANKLLER